MENFESHIFCLIESFFVIKEGVSMETSIPSIVKKAWNEWNIQVFLLASLLFHALSLFLTPFRKRSSNKLLNLLIWLSYMAANWAPGFAVGLITNTVTRNSNDDSKDNILTFWTPFLLLHLGGADTSTSFAIEDNELWIRYIFTFLFQFISSAYIFYLSLSHNSLWPPTLLIFLAGFLKCTERARAQYLATRGNFKNNSSLCNHPLYAEILEKSRGKTNRSRFLFEATHPRFGSSSDTKLKTLDVVKYAYYLFETYKGLIVGDDFTPEEYETGLGLVLDTIKDGNEAFRVVEAEVYMIYEVFHTKAGLYCSKVFVISRFVYWSLLIATLAIFAFMDKGGAKFRSVDVAVTYTLLLGTIFLDAVALVIMIFSSYLVVASFIKSFPSWVIKLLRPSEAVMQIWSRCFPQTVQQYNLISHCLLHPSTKCKNLLRSLGLGASLNEMEYVSEVQLPMTPRLRRIIFKHAKPHDGPPEQKVFIQPKDHWAYHFPYPTDRSHSLLHATSDTEFLIIFHIATEICYTTDDAISNDSSKSRSANDYRIWCKHLSDYMMYLVVFRPSALSTVAKEGYQNIIEKALAEAAELNISRGAKTKNNQPLDQRTACAEILSLADSHNMNDDEVVDQSESGNNKLKILYRASVLANELISSQDASSRWIRLLDVWLDRLLEAAKWSRPSFHAQNLGNGCHFVTLVWLLMAHIGIGSQYRVPDWVELNIGPRTRLSLIDADIINPEFDE